MIHRRLLPVLVAAGDAPAGAAAIVSLALLALLLMGGLLLAAAMGRRGWAIALTAAVAGLGY